MKFLRVALVFISSLACTLADLYLDSTENDNERYNPTYSAQKYPEQRIWGFIDGDNRSQLSHVEKCFLNCLLQKGHLMVKIYDISKACKKHMMTMATLFLAENVDTVIFCTSETSWNHLTNVRVIPRGPLEMYPSDHLLIIEELFLEIFRLLDIDINVYFRLVPNTVHSYDVLLSKIPIKVENLLMDV